MSGFTVQFDTDNAAFADEGGTEEVVRILNGITSLALDGFRDGRVLDINGNVIGSWKLELPEAEDENEDIYEVIKIRVDGDEHEHRFQGQTLRHQHPHSYEHGYFEHEEDES